MHEVLYVLTERFNKQHSSGAHKDNPSLYDFGYNDNTIEKQKVFKPIAAENLHDEQTNFETDTICICFKIYLFIM